MNTQLDQRMSLVLLIVSFAVVAIVLFLALSQTSLVQVVTDIQLAGIIGEEPRQIPQLYSPWAIDANWFRF